MLTVDEAQRLNDPADPTGRSGWEANMARSIDALRAERYIFLAASVMAIGATLDAAHLAEDPSAQTDGRLLAATRRMADLQVGCLSAHDRFIGSCEDVGLDRESIAALRYPAGPADDTAR